MQSGRHRPAPTLPLRLALPALAIVIAVSGFLTILTNRNGRHLANVRIVTGGRWWRGGSSRGSSKLRQSSWSVSGVAFKQMPASHPSLSPHETLDGRWPCTDRGQRLA